MQTSERLALFRSLRGKQVFIAGAGRQGIAAARLALSLNARVVIGDDTAEERVIESLRQAGISPKELAVHAGGIRHEDTAHADLVVLSAGFPRAHSAIRSALEHGIPVCNEVELGAAQLQTPVIVGITGTNGKSTTTTMLGDILHLHDSQVFVGGNLGVPLCEHVADGGRPKFIALELSSYQLETIETLPLQAAIVTNLAPDHLDRYPCLQDYYDAKARIFSLLLPTGMRIINQLDPVSKAFFSHLGDHWRFDIGVPDGHPGVRVQEDGLTLVHDDLRANISIDNPRIIGPHNRQNAAAAVAAASALHVPLETIQRGLFDYRGIPHRLERLGVANGVQWYNDSKATNVESARTALQSFAGRVHLIVGGVGKGSSYRPLVETAEKCVVRVYAIGEEAPALVEAFAGHVDARDEQTLENAVLAARAQTQPGDILLLAPACASFDQFQNYQARGDAFRTLFEATLGET